MFEDLLDWMANLDICKKFWLTAKGYLWYIRYWVGCFNLLTQLNVENWPWCNMLMHSIWCKHDEYPTWYQNGKLMKKKIKILIQQAVREAATICPHSLQVHLWPLTLKVVSKSHVTWVTSVPILVFLGLSLLNWGPMYVTDRQTDVRHASWLNAPYRWGRCIINGYAVLILVFSVSILLLWT